MLNTGNDTGAGRLLLESPDQKEVRVIEAGLKEGREALYSRLSLLNHPYHNKKHILSVQETLSEMLDNLVAPVSTKERLLLNEAVLRHDIGHCGKTYRQDVEPGVNMSNEEFAVATLYEDLGSALPVDALGFIAEHILVTSFGQSDKEALRAVGKEGYYREYKPESRTQKLMALADTLRIETHDEWLTNARNLLRESSPGPNFNIDDWLKGQLSFSEIM
jgi:hypothetical protein